MRIPKLEGWLVAVALAWGTAEGAYVTFDQGFEGDLLDSQAAASSSRASPCTPSATPMSRPRVQGLVSGSVAARAADMGGSPTTPSPGSAVGGGGGLARGAVIGIAVGCAVVGLLIIAGLAWYLLRRHRRKKALQSVDSSYGPDNRGNEVLMAEKEAAADVDVTPHSPYSDDGVSGGPGGAGAGPGGSYPEEAAVVAGAVGTAAAASPPPHLQDPPRSFTPYSDRPSAGPGAGPAAGTPSVRAASLAQTDDARVSVPSPVSGRATPRALTTPYAHLVEDGMTEEEIRRLEEEERQLDAAIEQAGRR
ncbi:Kin of IRRE-like protein 3 [Corynascus novoguineensis]|uniref:Kin of IRRE-like protein 3 n=1 Tax=Corynascus novoguineensis TaxID=1126955 RepID=A0AAN7HMF2_9PEZI|nr:Kin of IRRE-like protein 3 [Corynascus novoguineensis]